MTPESLPPPENQEVSEDLLTIQKLKTEIQVQAADLQLKQLEIDSRKTSKHWLTGITPAHAAVVAAAFAFCGSLIGSFFQGRSAQELKRAEFESNLVLRAVETGDVEASSKNLKFLLAAGFIQDSGGRINRLLTDSEYSIQLPARPGALINSALATGDYKTVLREICVAAGLTGNFTTLLEANVPNAISVIRNSERIILINPRWLEEFKKGRSDMSAVFALAHEVGHHLLGHDLIRSNANDQQAQSIRLEILQADKFAGFVLYRIGGTQSDIHKALSSIPEGDYSNLPGRAARIQAAEEGWTESAKSAFKINNP